MITIEQAWKIMRNEMTIGDEIDLIYGNGPFKDGMIESIKSEPGGGIWTAFGISLEIKRNTYDFLVDAGEIDKNRHFHLSSGDYFNPEITRKFDIFIKEGKLYRYNNNEFEFMY